MLLLFCLGYSFLKRRFFCNLTRWKCSWCRKMTNSVEAIIFHRPLHLHFSIFRIIFCDPLIRFAMSALVQTLLSNQPRENSGLEVCHVVAYTTVKQKQMVGSYLPCPLLRLYYTIYVSFYKNKNNLYKYEAMLVIFVSNSKISGLGDSLIYRDKLSICWEENDSVM